MLHLQDNLTAAGGVPSDGHTLAVPYLKGNACKARARWAFLQDYSFQYASEIMHMPKYGLCNLQK